jgi:iron complex outermembrane receptor protein
VWLAPTYPAFPNGPISGGLPCPETPQCRPSISETQTSPMAAVAYNWTQDLSSYFRFSTGYQAPGLGVGSQTFQYVAASKVNSFEVGMKSEFADRTARLNLAAFYTDWKDPQENIQTTSSSTVEFFSGPTIHIYGVELESTYIPVTGLTLNASFTWMHGTQGAATNPFPPPAGFPPVSALFHIVNLPEWAASLAATDDLAHTDYGVWRVNLQANGTASYYTVPNVSMPVGSYWLLNGRFGLAEIPLGSNGGQLEVAVWGNNLLNKSYNVFMYEVQGPNLDGAFGPPRMWGGSVRYRFR